MLCMPRNDITHMYDKQTRTVDKGTVESVSRCFAGTIYGGMRCAAVVVLVFGSYQFREVVFRSSGVTDLGTSG
jgi:hypothetical protein